jgi:hypothetical protein
MAYPTTLDILLTRVCAVEARLAVLENQSTAAAAAAAGHDELEAALAKLGAAIKLAGRGGRFNE